MLSGWPDPVRWVMPTYMSRETSRAHTGVCKKDALGSMEVDLSMLVAMPFCLGIA